MVIVVNWMIMKVKYILVEIEGNVLWVWILRVIVVLIKVFIWKID